MFYQGLKLEDLFGNFTKSINTPNKINTPKGNFSQIFQDKLSKSNSTVLTPKNSPSAETEYIKLFNKFGKNIIEAVGKLEPASVSNEKLISVIENSLLNSGFDKVKVEKFISNLKEGSSKNAKEIFDNIKKLLKSNEQIDKDNDTSSNENILIQNFQIMNPDININSLRMPDANSLPSLITVFKSIQKGINEIANTEDTKINSKNSKIVPLPDFSVNKSIKNLKFYKANESNDSKVDVNNIIKAKLEDQENIASENKLNIKTDMLNKANLSDVFKIKATVKDQESIISENKLNIKADKPDKANLSDVSNSKANIKDNASIISENKLNIKADKPDKANLSDVSNSKANIKDNASIISENKLNIKADKPDKANLSDVSKIKVKVEDKESIISENKLNIKADKLDKANLSDVSKIKVK
ncbi:MAG: hypothetical protein HQK76_05125, partial [Desulfobacterales bacterium]|nr:hypothetical protein [Desulfobacterales bacterium]